MKAYGSEYLPGMNLSDYLKLMADKFPLFSETFCFEKPDALKIMGVMEKARTDFEGKAKGGRGDLYRKAQQDASVRMTGIKQLLKLAVQNYGLENLPSDYKILDVLGGDGILARAYALLRNGNGFRQPILTGDIAADMVEQALKYNLPAIRQPAQHLFLKDNSFDAVILAYGVHHISPRERLTVCKEAFRVLKPKGRVVIHDFEDGSSIAHWFNKVVDKYSLTGHRCSHFTPDELRLYLAKSGFKNIKIFHLYDPFIISDTEEQHAWERLMDYVLNMYGLEKLIHDHDLKTAQKTVYHLIKRHIFYSPSQIRKVKNCGKESLSFYKENGYYIAEMPRIALVAVGTK